MPRRQILQLNAGTCMSGSQALKKNVFTWPFNGLTAFQTVNNGSLN